MKILGYLILAACLGAGAVLAQSPAPFPEFSAKRIKPPSSGATNRITIQIDPSEQIAAKPAPVPSKEGEVVAEPVGSLGWFWDEVSPELTSSGPGRLDDALLAIRAKGAVPTPRLQLLQEIAQAHGVPILMSTVGTNVSPALVLAVIAVESSGHEDAVSGAGAQGLMQLMPDTADRFSVVDSFAAEENIDGGVQYLDWLLQEFDNDPILALAGYNAGEGSVRNYSGVPPFAETRDYVPKVLAAFDVARGLCATPPELISDGCVFVTMGQ
ncbi:MAG: lytic transglycosylase domain-containing protein [Paracoccaceae bacterium]